VRSKALAVLAIAIGVSILTGCGVSRRQTTESSWWKWETSKAPQRPSLQEQYNIAVGPERPQLSGRHGFDFTHPKVGTFVARYQTDLRGFYGRALERSGRYLPRIESILRKEGVPQELAYLPLIESGFRITAQSPASAVGLWQFIPGTGRRYGLRIDGYVDERRDPVKSTRAAARYLKDLYGMFGDWHLSLAAYNTGENRIVRIMNNNDADDFWEMSERGYLYRETEEYVPGFLAALQIASAPERYGFEPPALESDEYDIVHVHRPCSLSKIAEWCGTSTDVLKELNPALLRGVVPPRGYQVRLPKGSKRSFEAAYASLSPSELAAIERAATAPPVARRCVHKGRRVPCASTRGKARNGSGTKGKVVRVSARSSRAAQKTTAASPVRTGVRASARSGRTVVASSAKRSKRTVD
jgi:membrane-bound lytic murein transglycosylase D